MPLPSWPRWRALACAMLAALLLAPGAVLAQAEPSPPATLVADRIYLANSDVLVADGNVIVFYRGAQLTATNIAYDAQSGELRIEGPIRLAEAGAEGSVLLADSAQLSADLRDGVLQGARMVLARELQLAANTISRSEGRFTTLEQVVASSCQICVTDPTPLWEIRARRVVHDALKRQLVFDNAQFRALGVPLAYFPRLQLPDPTATRMTGFLMPEIRTTSGLGTGFKLPYFVALGPSRDLTLTAYLAAASTRTLEARYRQALRFGTLQFSGAVSRDDLLADRTRRYLFGDASFDLAGGTRLGLQLRLSSDRAYLLDYGITADDRLWSGATLERLAADRLLWARLGNTQSLREGESNATEPMLAGDLRWLRVWQPATIGGELVFEARLHGHRRQSSLAFDGPDPDADADGRDLLSAALMLEWRRNWLTAQGLQLGALVGLGADFHAVGQDNMYAGTTAALRPQLALDLRWPWLRVDAGATQVIEPVAQLVWSTSDNSAVPNEDSRLVEFDQGNLFALSRFPGIDAREGGLRANLGVSWTRQSETDWSAALAVGRVLRLRDPGGFGSGSGLAGTRSDWLLAARLGTTGGLSIANRALIADDLSFSRDELRLSLQRGSYALTAGYIWMQPDMLEGRPLATSELLLDTTWKWASGWTGSLGSRYDFTAGRAASARLGLRYETECLALDVSLSRRFTSSTSVRPETDFGLSVALAGFGAGSGGQRRSCMR